MLPYLTCDLPGIGGVLKHAPEDFEVEEIPAYEPCGEGEHLFLWVEKRDLSAEDLTRHVARALELPVREIGVAGLKDRRAVTRQYVSVPAAMEPRLGRLETDSVHVHRTARHRNKLRTGHLRGNRFSLLIRGAAPGAVSLAATIAERIRQWGFPNYFGEQRFGRDDETLRLGMDLLRGNRSPRALQPSRRQFLLRLSLSAAQSFLFNEALAERLRDDLHRTVLPGDVMQVTASGGLFVAEDIGVEQQRLEAGETAITGPIFGPKMCQPAGQPAEREARLLIHHGLEPKVFQRYQRLTSGTRRPYLQHVQDLEITAEPDGLRFRFSLPSGTYATSLLREFRKESGDTALRSNSTD